MDDAVIRALRGTGIGFRTRARLDAEVERAAMTRPTEAAAGHRLGTTSGVGETGAAFLVVDAGAAGRPAAAADAVAAEPFATAVVDRTLDRAWHALVGRHVVLRAPGT